MTKLSLLEILDHMVIHEVNALAILFLCMSMSWQDTHLLFLSSQLIVGFGLTT